MYRVVDEDDRLVGAGTTFDIAYQDLAFLVAEVSAQVAGTGEGATQMRLELRIVDAAGRTVASFSGSPVGGYPHSG